VNLKPKRKGKRITDQGYLDAVDALGCCLCGMPATIHHVHAGEGMGQRAADYRSIPLCPKHHQHGGLGVAIEAGRNSWQIQHGSEADWLEWVWEKLDIPEETREQWRQREYI
jgi:hypothetical protein